MHPMIGSNWISKYLLLWITPLIKLASERGLLEADVWNVPPEETVATATETVWDGWFALKMQYDEEMMVQSSSTKQDGYEHIDAQKLKAPSFLDTLQKGFGYRIKVAGCFHMCFIIFQMCQPYIVRFV